MTDAVVAETIKSLAAHELIKVRIDGDDRRDIAEALAKATGSEVAAIIGKTAIVYRPREEKPSIRLPGGTVG